MSCYYVSLDQYLCDFSDHGRSDCNPLYTYIFRLILRMVLLGFSPDYDNLWYVSTFVFPIHGYEQLFGIFSHGSVV
jgi:hypothetical protein